MAKRIRKGKDRTVKYYVHVNALRPDGTRDTFYTESFDSLKEAENYLAEVQGSDELNTDERPATIWEAEIQASNTDGQWKGNDLLARSE